MGIPLWKDADGKDWITNAATKPKMLENLKDTLLRGSLPILDSWTVGELRAFKVDDRGNPFCPRNGIHHGDTVIALALALQCALKVSVPDRPYLPQFVLDRRTREAFKNAGKQQFRRY